MLFLLATLLVWLLLIAPLQYFVFLVAGAPVRLNMNASETSMALKKNGKWEIIPLKKSQVEARKKETPEAEKTVELTLSKKPVTIASAFATALFLLLDMLR